MFLYIELERGVKEMRIGIVGSYGGGSIGDEAILKGLLNLLDNVNININEVIVYSSNSNNTFNAIQPIDYKFNVTVLNWNGKKGINKSVEKIEIKNRKSTQKSLEIILNSRKILSKKIPLFYFSFENIVRKLINKPMYTVDFDDSLDYLIFGGGNILMDIYPNWPYFLNAVIRDCETKNIKLIFQGVGAGPIVTYYGKKVIREIIENFYVSTRDLDSKTILENLTNKTIEIRHTADLALGLHNEEQIIRNKLGISVTVIPYFASYYWPSYNDEKYNNYCSNMAKILDQLIVISNEKIELFATNYPFDTMAAEEIKNKMHNKNAVSILNKKLTVNNLLEYCKTKKIIIGTRLHSLILSVVRDTNIIGISYQPKVTNFLRKYKLDDQLIDIKILENKMNEAEIMNEVEKIIKTISKKIELNFPRQEKKLLETEITYYLKNKNIELKMDEQ